MYALRVSYMPSVCILSAYCIDTGPDRMLFMTLSSPSSAVVITQGRESRGSGFEACSDVWNPRRRPRGAAINTLVDLNKLAGESPGLS